MDKPGVTSGPVPEPLAKALLYGGAPFFAWPVKPALNAATGKSYKRAYAHFRRDHQDPLNLIYHAFCLVFQLGFNYALLTEAGTGLAKLMRAGPRCAELLPAVTTAAWSWTLLRAQGAPAAVRVAAVGCVALAHATRHFLARRWRQAMYFTGVLEMMAVQVFLIEKVQSTSGQGRKPLNVRRLLKLVLVRLSLQNLAERVLAGRLSGPGARGATNAALAAFMAKVSQDPFGTKTGRGPLASPFMLGTVGWLLSLVTDQRWLYFYSGGFLASMVQGVSHHYAGEEGTLPQLADVGDEFAHTTYFPVLLLHSMYQSLRSGHGLAPSTP